jgi:poly(A) polymerase
MIKPAEYIPRDDRLFQSASAIVTRLLEAGYTAYIVGGAVRDIEMGISPKDYDIATDAGRETLYKLFRHVHPVGASFGVHLVVFNGHAFEVARFRTEHGYSDSRHPDEVNPSSFEEDVRRRDFTINALALDIENYRIIDHVGGIDDIHRGVIRAIGNPPQRFAEDKLRMMRAIRFASRFGFTIDSVTWQALCSQASGVESVSAERVRDELAGMFTTPTADTALKLLYSSGILEVVLPEVAAFKGTEQPKEYHPEGDVFTHVLKMYEFFEGGAVTLAFGILLHDVGKPSTQSYEDRIRFSGHNEIGADIAADILQRLRMKRTLIQTITGLVRDHMRFKDVRNMRDATFRRFVSRDYFPELLELHRLDCLGSHGDLSNYEYVVRRREELAIADENSRALPPPLLSGKDLLDMGYEEGPVIGEILDAVQEKQLDREIASRDEAIRFVRRAFPAP